MLAVVLTFAAAGARARIDFPSVTDRAIGIRAGTGVFHRETTGPAWSVEAGDVELFGIAGLRVSGVRANGRAASLLAGLSIAQLSSPVGSESRAELELGYRPSARWLCLARGGIEMVSIPGTPGESAVVAGFHSRAQAGPISAIADVDVVSRAGARDVELSIGLVGRIGAASIVTTSRFDGNAVASVGIAVVSRFAGRLALLAGYDDGTESIRGAAVVSFSCWQFDVGVFQHAVLGVSQGVTISWLR
ncbi:MAG TPA: hypothetical protein VFU38_07280 [Candidatus Krumholzibacteria bacterium]|nr:hypothetical protein [Candidatus Krumholzibacteria bacterium]